jgi:hypothetical protein
MSDSGSGARRVSRVVAVSLLGLAVGTLAASAIAYLFQIAPFSAKRHRPIVVRNGPIAINTLSPIRAENANAPESVKEQGSSGTVADIYGNFAGDVEIANVVFPITVFAKTPGGTSVPILSITASSGEIKFSTPTAGGHLKDYWDLDDDDPYRIKFKDATAQLDRIQMGVNEYAWGDYAKRYLCLDFTYYP